MAESPRQSQYRMSWTEHPIHFVDFEGSRTSGILEYGVATLAGGRVTETRTRRCRPTGRVRPEDVAVHGLAPAALAGEPPFAADWELFAGLRERGPLAAHYAGTENSLLKSVWPYARRSPDFAWPGRQTVEWGPWIDSARLCAQRHPGIGSGRLEAMVGALGLQAELDLLAAERCPPDRRRYHAALYDALAGALLLGLLARDPAARRLSLRRLLALSTLDPRKRDALAQEKLW
jgi:DNA polymerase III subunit epsilon